MKYYVCMERMEKRGVVVYTQAKGESHKQIGLYTEQGMVYFTIYGAKSSKGHTKSVVSLFTMGNFVFNIANNQHKFVDVTIFDNAMMLGQQIQTYYAACVGAELVKILVGTDHKRQFNVLTHFLLRLIKQKGIVWRNELSVFLWRSLVYSGWYPNLPPLGEENQFLSYREGEGLVKVLIKEGYEPPSLAVSHDVLYLLDSSMRLGYEHACSLLEKLPIDDTQKLVQLLLYMWQHILGRALRSASMIFSHTK